MSSSTETVTFTVNKEQSVADTGSNNAGSGGDDHGPIGAYSGWIRRTLLRASMPFGSAPAGGWEFIDAELWMKTTSYVHQGVGDDPRVRIGRLTGPFTMGGGGENSWTWGGSYEVWPGPGQTGSIDLPEHTRSENVVVKFDISDPFEPLIPSSMYYRDNSLHTQVTNDGFRVSSYGPDGGGSRSEFYTMRGSYAPRFVVRYRKGVLPPAPVLTAPSGNVSAAPTSFTATAQETPCSKYAVQVSTDPTFASGMLWDVSAQTAGISGAAITATYAGTTQPTGVPIYWRMRTANDIGSGVYGAWSAGVSYTIVVNGTGVITYPVADGLARISNLTEAVEWATGGLHAKPELTWRFNDTLGREATSIVVVLRNDAGTVQFTDTITGPFAANTDHVLSTYTRPVVRATFMKIEVIPYVGAVAQTSSGQRRFKCQWGQGVYTVAPGASATGHRFVGPQPTGTEARAAYLHRFRDGVTTGPWKTTIAGAGTIRTNWDVLVRMSTRSGMPVLGQMEAYWNTSAVAPVDQWQLDNGTLSLDDAFRRFGVKSLKVVTAAGLTGHVLPKPDPSEDGIIVSERTVYTFSVYVNTLGAVLNSYVMLAVHDASGAHVWDSGSIPEAMTDDSSGHPEGWQRLWATFVSPDAATRLIPVIHVGGAASDEIRLDAPQFEEGSYASPWTPGLLGPQVILDKGGFQVDASKGGLFRLKGSTAGIRNVVELYQKGLRFANDTELSSPSVGVLAINGAPIGPESVAFTPTWAGSTTNPVIVNGEIIGRYVRIGDLCYIDIRITMGSSTTYGSGNYTIGGLPFPNDADAGRIILHGTARSTVTYPAYLEIGPGSSFGTPRVDPTTAGAAFRTMSPTVPMTWAVGDVMSFAGVYRV